MMEESHGTRLHLRRLKAVYESEEPEAQPEQRDRTISLVSFEGAVALND